MIPTKIIGISINKAKSFVSILYNCCYSLGFCFCISCSAAAFEMPRFFGIPNPTSLRHYFMQQVPVSLLFDFYINNISSQMGAFWAWWANILAVWISFPEYILL